MKAESNRFIVSVDPGSDFTVQGEYVSGPAIGGGDIVNGPRIQVFLVDGGNFWIINLVPNSDYVVRFRRTYFFNRTTNTLSTVTSGYTTFSFHTPVAPPDPRTIVLIAPQNVRAQFAASHDTTLISWDVVPGALTYEYTIDGVNFERICYAVTYCEPAGAVTPIASIASALLPGKQFRVRAVGASAVVGGELRLGPLSAPLNF